MKADTPSRTAAWVALARGMADRLPAQARLAEDPYGAAFEQPGGRARLHRVLDRAGIPVHRMPGVTMWILYMQVRTRVIDDALRGFVAAGGRQVVLLGAGYDCRALRLPELANASTFEVDHPATQRHKRAVLDKFAASSPAHYLTWDFEQRPMTELPAALAAAGHDPRRRTFTIWEGVTMYLSEPAIDASLRAIRAWSAPGSQLAMTYFAKSRLTRPTVATRAISAIVSRIGEPWRFGWAPDELPAYLAARGFALVTDRTMMDVARELLPSPYAARVLAREQRFALASAQESVAVSEPAH